VTARFTLFATTLCLAIPHGARAVQQHADHGLKLPALLSEAEEIRLARSAAPPQVSANATVWVLHRGGHVKVKEGSNGVNCIVQRDHPESVYPLCYDAEASRTILPIALLESKLREAGRTGAEIDRAIDAGIASGELKLPQGTAMAYMQSPGQVIFAGAEGPRVGTWRPHVMFYIPNATAEKLGFGATEPPGITINEAGRPTAHLIIVTPLWSDGRPGPALAAS
jgi:hypothetical protein